jgi:hypothetical protein
MSPGMTPGMTPGLTPGMDPEDVHDLLHDTVGAVPATPGYEQVSRRATLRRHRRAQASVLGLAVAMVAAGSAVALAAPGHHPAATRLTAQPALTPSITAPATILPPAPTPPGGSTVPLTSGVSTAASPAPPPAPEVEPVPIVSPTYAHHEAEVEAAHLLSLLAPPSSGARRVSSFSGLAGPGFGTPLSANLIDDNRIWVVSMTYQQALHYIQTHGPHGFSANGTASSSGPGTQTNSIGYPGPASPYWDQPEAEWTVAKARNGQVGLRADGSDLWVNPTPTRDTQSGPRVRLTLSSACPSSAHDVDNPGQNLSDEMVPAGQPTTGLVCWYRGANAPPAPVRQALSAEQAQRAAASARSLQLGNTGGGVTSCPAGFGGAALVVLAYPGHPDVDLYWADSGCESVDNGQITTGGGLNLDRPPS